MLLLLSKIRRKGNPRDVFVSKNEIASRRNDVAIGD
jgi:hypothetical protein